MRLSFLENQYIYAVNNTILGRYLNMKENLSPKGEFFKERTEGSLWFECLSFTLCYSS